VTRSWGSSPEVAAYRSTGPTARTPPRSDVEWDEDTTGAFVALIEVRGIDRPRLLADVISMLSDNHISILTCHSHVDDERVARIRLEFELGDSSHLDMVLKRIQTVEGVFDAERALPASTVGSAEPDPRA